MLDLTQPARCPIADKASRDWRPEVQISRGQISKSSTWAVGFLPEGLTLLALLVFWMACHPFRGSAQGTLIYITHALADLDPDGIGRDMMFRYDGQSAFTVTTPVFRILVQAFGVAATELTLSALAMLAWFVALVAFTRQFVGRGATIAVVIFVALLPAFYGGFQLFAYAEPGATPRPFAEALTLAALSALLARRWGLAGLCLAAATLLHPIMALAGLIVAAMFFCVEDRRNVFAVGIIGVAVFAAAALHVPLAERLFATIDPAWRALLLVRNPHLYPSLWPSGWEGRVAVRLATILIALPYLERRARWLMLAAIGAGLLGLGASIVLGDRIQLLLVVQAQPWRMLWLPFALGAVCAAVCVQRLWPRGGMARIVLVLLGLGWTFADQTAAAVAFAGTALVLQFGLSKEREFVPAGVASLLALALGGLLIGAWVHKAIDISHFVACLSGAALLNLWASFGTAVDFLPLAVVLFGLTNIARHRIAPIWIGLGAAFGLCGLALYWDARPVSERTLDAGLRPPDLVALVATKPGEVLWIDDTRKTWALLQRPHWVSAVQGAGLVFSRDLATRFGARAARAIAFGLADDDILTPLTPPHQSEIPVLVPERVHAFCAMPDAPAWIIAPLVPGADWPAGLEGTIWTAGFQNFEFLQKNERVHSVQIDRYAVVPCAG